MKEVFATGTIGAKTRERVKINKTHRISAGKFRRKLSRKDRGLTMQTRPDNTAHVKGQLIRAAVDLFRTQGLRGTSPMQIVLSSNTKMRHFYYHFKNKQGIARAVLQHCLEAIQAGTAPVRCDVRSWEDLSQWFFDQADLQRSYGMQRSCLIGGIATGVTEQDEQIRNDLCLIFDLIANKLAAFFTLEKARNHISKDTHARELADFCIATAQGALLIGKITQDSQRVLSAMRAALECIGAGTEAPHNCRSRQERPLSRPAAIHSAVELDCEKAQIAETDEGDADARLKMITVAADLFHKQGVNATSPAQIIEVSQTGKGQFYYYFKSKQGLVHEVLQDRLREITSNCSQVNYRIQSWPDLERWFSTQIDVQRKFGMARSCPLGTIADETMGSDTLLDQDVRLIFEVIHNKLAAFFIREKARGALSPARDEDALAAFCIATLQGAMLLGKVRRNADVVERIVRRALAHVEEDVVARTV